MTSLCGFNPSTPPIPIGQKAVADGVATLDSGGKIPASQIPSSITVDSLVTAQRWIYEKEFGILNVPVGVTNLNYSFAPGTPISFVPELAGKISTFRISMDFDPAYTAWTLGTATFGIVKSGFVVFMSSAFTKAAFDAAAGSFFFIKSVDLAVDIDFVAGDELSCEIATSGSWNGTGIELHMIQHGFYDNT